MNRFLSRRLPVLSLVARTAAFAISLAAPAHAAIGLGAKPPAGAEVIIDGTRQTLDQKWTYWEGPRFDSSLPIKWKIVDDPVDGGTAVQSFDPAAAGGKYGAADIITKKTYRDFRLHIEFLVMNEGGNSGVYLQNRYEIQICDGDKTKHGMGAVINETESPYHCYRGLGQWNAYDIVFRAARFKDGQRVEPAMVTMYFNGEKVHHNQLIQQVWGGPNSGLDGGNDKGKGITDVPGPLKLQAEGHDVRYRNAWIKELDLSQPDTEFSEANASDVAPRTTQLFRPTETANADAAMSSPHSESPAAEAARERARAASKLLATEGEAAFARLESPPFRSGDDYVFVFDWQGTLVVHAMPSLRGVDVRDERDVNGKAFGQEFIAVAQSPAGEGWVEYWWPRPGGGAPQLKRSYITRVPGRELGVGAGIYESQ